MTDPARPFDDSAGVPNRGLGACDWDARWTAKDTPWGVRILRNFVSRC